MYVSEVVPQLVTSLAALCSKETTVLVAHGRNRPAEPEFKAAAQQHFSIELVPSSELDPVYQVSRGRVCCVSRYLLWSHTEPRWPACNSFQHWHEAASAVVGVPQPGSTCNVWGVPGRIGTLYLLGGA
jgi:hypothetical protein